MLEGRDIMKYNYQVQNIFMGRTYSPNEQRWNTKLTEWKITWKKIRGKTTAKMGRRQDRLFIARGLKRIEKTHWVGTTGVELLKIPGPDTDCRGTDEGEGEGGGEEEEEEEEEEDDDDDYFNSC